MERHSFFTFYLFVLSAALTKSQTSLKKWINKIGGDCHEGDVLIARRLSFTVAEEANKESIARPHGCAPPQ